MFVEQPLASPGSAKNTAVLIKEDFLANTGLKFNTFGGCSDRVNSGLSLLFIHLEHDIQTKSYFTLRILSSISFLTMEY